MKINYSNLIDEWKLLTDDDIRINDNIIVKHHTVKDVLETGKSSKSIHP